MAKGNRLEEEVYQFILDKIQTFTWQPGEHIKEQDVAKELDTSRTPVRKALKRLEEEKYIIIEPYKGAKILKPRLDAKNFLNRTELLELLLIHYFYKLEGQEQEVVTDSLIEAYYNMSENLYSEEGIFEGYEFIFWEELLQNEENQYSRLIIFDTFRSLFPDQGKIRKIMYQNRKVKLQHIEQLIEYIKDSNYPYVRREIRIFVNQMNLDIIQGI